MTTMLGSVRGRVAMAVVVVALLVLAAGPVLAHPLGNFSVNHHHTLVLSPDELQLRSVVDMAEVPTQQERSEVDVEGDGEISPSDLEQTAQRWCADMLRSLTTSVDGAAAGWVTHGVDLVEVAGAAGLPTLRLTCDLRAQADLSDPATVVFVDDYRGERVGWHEIVAVGDGVTLVDPSVPATSVSDELRAYPDDLLSTPLDVRQVTLRVEPGASSVGEADLVAGSGSSGDPFSRMVAAGDQLLQSTIGRDRLTPLVGGLALLLAALLGAGHALLPGHGKTVMAAYLAGRRGTRVDALIVGGTVTITHTAGVLLLGLVLTVGSAVAGEVVLQRLGVVSGVLIAAIGAGLLRDAVRSRRARRARTADPTLDAERHGAVVAAVPVEPSMVAVGAGAGTHATAHGHQHDADHDHGTGLDHEHHPVHGHAHDHGHLHPHDHAHGHDHDHDHDHDHRNLQPHDHEVRGALDHDQEHGGGHDHHHDGAFGWGHSHHHGPAEDDTRFSRRGLVGMAVAGGLVPSPSALVVLLGSIALGRTLFGTTLVLAYGVGMAATLTAVGLLLVRLRSRLDRMSSAGWTGRWAARLTGALPIATAGLVLVVGLGLVARALAVSA